jgi:hypothetical protein
MGVHISKDAYRCTCCGKVERPCGCLAPFCDGCDRCSAHCACSQIGQEVPAVRGVGRDAPISTNEKGGQQSASPYSLVSSFPSRALLAVAAVVRRGLTRYKPNNWRLISREDHLNHALTHIVAFNAGDRSDEHLEHAACRLLMALETE